MQEKEVIKMKWFKNIKTKQELRKRYRELCKQYHPDVNSDTDGTEMKEINSEYDELIKFLPSEKTTEPPADNTHESTADNAPDIYRVIIEKIISIPDIQIEIIGTWLWVSGKTYEYRDIFKGFGMRYSKAKKAWYYNGGNSEYHRGYHKNLDEIRNKYGSAVFTNETSHNKSLK